jgi:beta-glucosidase-like glycosyl hydrolase
MHTRLVMPDLRFPRDADDPSRALRLAAEGVAGFCVFSGDARLAGLLQRLRAVAPHPLLIAADLEEGAGQQIEGCIRHPPAASLDPDGAEAAGIRTAVEARPVGIDLAFAPVCDVVSHPSNPIIQSRAFRDPVACAPRFIEGARRFGLKTCAKHFPGHGGTAADSHAALPVVDAPEALWRERDLPPFRACVEAGVDAVMTAHIACPALTGSPTLPATLSRRVVTDLLRTEMGFAGLVVTDALVMEGVLAGRTEVEAARLALEAGCDLLLCPREPEALLEALRGVEAEAAVARVAAAAEPVPDPLEAAVEAALTTDGPLPVGPGTHPLRICDLQGAGRELARTAGLAYELYAPDGRLLEAGEGPGLAVPTVVLAWRDRAWGEPLEAPPAVRALAEGAGLLVVLGPAVLAEGSGSAARIIAPGRDALTLRVVIRRARGAENPPRRRGPGPADRLLS